MKYLSTVKKLAGGLTLAAALLATSAAGVHAAPGVPTQPDSRHQNSGPQAKAPVEPGSKDAKPTEKLGASDQVKAAAQGKPEVQSLALTGSVAGVDFQSPYNYCYKNLVYAPVKNTTGSTQYVRVQIYNQGGYHDVYTSVAAGGTAYAAFYGVEGAYTAYLYVWNGSNYQYDEYMSSNNTCNVSVTRTYNTGGWVQLKVQNLGTAYATQVSSELAPYPGSGTYTGTKYDYPVAGGAAIYRWFYVGTLPYGITSYTYGSSNSPYFFTGDL